MEQYLQELDKINQLLAHTDVKPAPFWNFLLAHPWLCLGVFLFVVIVFHSEEEGSRLAQRLIPFAFISGIGLIILIIGLFTDLATPKHDLINVTHDNLDENTVPNITERDRKRFDKYLTAYGTILEVLRDKHPDIYETLID